MDRRFKPPGRVADRVPSHRGVGAEVLSLNDRDAAMTLIDQMLQRQPGRAFVIERDVGHSRSVVVTGDRNHWQQRWAALRRINRDQPLDATFEEKLRAAFDQLGTMPMAGDEVKKAFLQQMVFDST